MSIANITVRNDSAVDVRIAHILYGNSCGMGEHTTETRVIKPGEELVFGVLKNSRLEVLQH